VSGRALTSSHSCKLLPVLRTNKRCSTCRMSCRSNHQPCTSVRPKVPQSSLAPALGSRPARSHNCWGEVEGRQSATNAGTRDQTCPRRRGIYGVQSTQRDTRCPPAIAAITVFDGFTRPASVGHPLLASSGLSPTTTGTVVSTYIRGRRRYGCAVAVGAVTLVISLQSIAGIAIRKPSVATPDVSRAPRHNLTRRLAFALYCGGAVTYGGEVVRLSWGGSNGGAVQVVSAAGRRA
jgi:hypothetical protein